MITFNFQDNEIVSSPTVIVSGKTSSGIDRGVVQFVNNANKVFPPQSFEVNGHGYFKAILHVSPGEPNVFDVQVFPNTSIGAFGFPDFPQGRAPNPIDTGKLTLIHEQMPQNKPVHLCVILGKDSNGSYDMPSYRLQRGEVANLDTAIRKLKVAGRLMQSFTQDDMRSNGFSNRTWQFTEETVKNQGIFGYDVDSPTPHQEVKIHVLRSPKTVAELRDPNLAQQNPKGKDTGGLFSHALDLIHKVPELWDEFEKSRTAIQCACLYIDATFDVKSKLILAHAALGGGTGEIKLAIFGSHGLHSWPMNFPQVTPSFLDSTHLTTKEVANDCNECGTSWECLNITMGAFMHEIGHLLGCPHQVDGVMLRDYVWFNRSFMTRESECLRRNTKGAVVRSQDGTWDKVCHWHRLDILRFFYHDSFSLPIDSQDPTFGKVYATTRISDKEYDANGSNHVPASYSTPSGGALIKSASGIYLIEFITDGLARHHIDSFPRGYGGSGFQNELMLDYESCLDELRRHTDRANENFDVRVLSLSGDLYINNFKEHCKKSAENVIRNDFGLGRGQLNGYKSALLGSKKQNMIIAGFDLRTVYKVRVYHGGALDGVRFYYTIGNNTSKTNSNDGGPPPIPARNYLKGFADKVSAAIRPPHQVMQNGGAGEPKSSLMGNEKRDYSEFILNSGEQITKFHFRDGQWIDAIQFETNQGRKSPMYGNAKGGHASTLESPAQGLTVVGMYGYVGSWMDGIGIIYSGDI
ncbi:hypothetical protein CAAN1_13S01244 [[Candida] anglica]|uniref:Jacalin-type lectin domain-containing protein n=1 Tax=[Candida] anglica TaxID=148631 RepID=A0ABP0EGG0_9ASCO